MKLTEGKIVFGWSSPAWPTFVKEDPQSITIAPTSSKKRKGDVRSRLFPLNKWLWNRKITNLLLKTPSTFQTLQKLKK